MTKQHSATVYTETGGIALIVQSIRRDGRLLVVAGKALGTMNMDMILTPGEFLKVLRLAFSWAVISYLLLLPYSCLTLVLNRARQRPASGLKAEQRRKFWKSTK